MTRRDFDLLIARIFVPARAKRQASRDITEA